MNTITTFVVEPGSNLPAGFADVVKAIAAGIAAERAVKGSKPSQFRNTFPALVPAAWPVEVVALLDKDPALAVPEGMASEDVNAIARIMDAAKEILSIGGPVATRVEAIAAKLGGEATYTWAPATFRKHLIAKVKSGMTVDAAETSAIATAKRVDFQARMLGELKRSVDKAPERIGGAGIGIREAATLQRLFAEAAKVLAGIGTLDVIETPVEAPVEEAKPAKVRKTKAAK